MLEADGSTECGVYEAVGNACLSLAYLLLVTKLVQLLCSFEPSESRDLPDLTSRVPRRRAGQGFLVLFDCKFVRLNGLILQFRHPLSLCQLPWGE